MLKSYKGGNVLKFRSFSKHWYEATVFVGGTKKKGYISAKDIELVTKKNQTIKGIGLKKPTKIYANSSTKAKVLKSYKKGQVLKYRKFSTNWYEATVLVNGKARRGFIFAKDVESVIENQQTMQGVVISPSAKVFSLASKDAKAIKHYTYGSILKFRTFANDWYEAKVYVNGKTQTGYLSKDDVSTDLNNALKGYAIAKSTAVHSNASKKSKVLKRYNQGHLLKYKPYNSNWFKATVKVNGKSQTGYIHTQDVSPYPPNMKAYTKSNPTYVYNKTSRNATKLKSYKQGQSIKIKYYNNSWYKATVYVKGKAKTGYIHVKDIVLSPVKKDAGSKIPILMYHQIGDHPRQEEMGRFVTAKSFKEQMKYLKSAGFTPIHFNEFSKIKNTKNPIIITFDDGFENNYIAYNILKELNDRTFKSKATFFIIGSKIDQVHYLSEKQLKEMSKSGIISIQAHTMNHPFFNDSEGMGKIDYKKELLGNKKKLEEITGKKVVALAYPYGSYNDFVINQTKKYYEYAVTTKSGIANTNDSPYELKRVRVSFDTTLKDFKKSIGK